MTACEWCGAPDADPTPNGHTNEDGRWINATVLLCSRHQREDELERMERSRT